MRKRNIYAPLGTIVVAIYIAACALVAPTGTPEAQYLTAAVTATQLVDQVAQASDKLVRAGTLKGQDALNTLNALKLARDGLSVSATMDPTQGLTKVQLVTAVLTATQVYLDKLGGALPAQAPIPSKGASA